MSDKSPTERVKVLVLDDEPDLRALLQRYLTERGFESRDWEPGALEVSLPPMPHLRAQRRSLVRAIANLLDNAVRHGGSA